MSEVKRYRVVNGAIDIGGGLRPDPDGVAVLHSDYAALEAKLQKAEDERDGFHRDWQGLLEHHEALETAILHEDEAEVQRLTALQGDMKPSDLSSLKAKLAALERVADAARKAVAAEVELARIVDIQGEDASETCEVCPDPEDCECDWGGAYHNFKAFMGSLQTALSALPDDATKSLSDTEEE